MQGNHRPRLLFLSHVLPYPPDSGVAIRTYHTLRLLAESFDVTALCFYRRAAVGGPDALERSLAALRRHADVDIFPIPQEHARSRLIGDHLRSIATGRVYTVPAYESAAYRMRLSQLLDSRRFDCIHVDSLDLAGYLPLLDPERTVCGHHNVESALLRRRAAAERSTLRSLYLRLQARLMAREEKRWADRLALNLVVSEEDRVQFEALVPSARFETIPNGVDVDAFRPAPESEEGLVFVGGTSWFPNLDALDHFAADILPHLRRVGVSAPVHWVGRASPSEQRHYADGFGIELTGYVEDIRPWVHSAACYVVPLRVGGGTRLKILDAWAMGKAVVSTSIGCEGLEAVDGENILIRDTPEAFALAVRQVLDDAALRERLGAGARATAERVYSWKVIGEKLNRLYLEVAGVTRPGRADAPGRARSPAVP